MSIGQDPAFLFYAQDFLTGCDCMTDEEVGQYIRILCLQHQKGHLCERDFNRKCSFDAVREKFVQDENGNYYNVRLQKEIDKRGKDSDASRENGKLGGRPAKPKDNLNETYRFSKTKPKDNLTEIENENENEIRIENKKNIAKKSDVPKLNQNFAPDVSEIAQELRISIGEWLEHRHEIKKPIKTQKQFSKFYAELLRLANSDFAVAKSIIDQSIANNWEGIFALKLANKPPPQQQKQSIEEKNAETFKRILEKHKNPKEKQNETREIYPIN